jgi:hypothetical protein
MEYFLKHNPEEKEKKELKELKELSDSLQQIGFELMGI